LAHLPKILITGASGSLGTQVLKLLGQSDQFIIVLEPNEHRLKASEWLKAGFQTVSLDLAESAQDFQRSIANLPSLPPIGICVHLAALYRFGADSNDVLRVNVLATENLLSWMLLLNCRKLVFASSIAAFLERSGSFFRTNGYREIYGVSKVQGEDLIQSYISQGKLDSAISHQLPPLTAPRVSTGHDFRLDGPYAIFEFLRTYQPLFKKLPASLYPRYPRLTPVCLMPLDEAAKLISDSVMNLLQNKDENHRHQIEKHFLTFAPTIELLKQQLEQTFDWTIPMILTDQPFNLDWRHRTTALIPGYPREGFSYFHAMSALIEPKKNRNRKSDSTANPYDTYAKSFLESYKLRLGN